MENNIKAIKQRFGIIGNSPLLDIAIETALKAAGTDMSVLIIGESGVGKEVFGKLIHQYSLRKHNNYIAVNCGALPQGTINSELFGHKAGSFTTAIADRKGYFEEADGGTIFLDEVGELPLETQAQLLRVLETGEFIPVGASIAQKTDVRIVAATNVKLEEAVRQGRFREDLYYRLNTIPIALPPLRKRREDIGLLFRFFAAQSADKNQSPPLRLQDDARQVLEQYHWPGNIRELRNLTNRISVLEEDRLVTAEMLRRYLPQAERTDYRPALISSPEAGHYGGGNSALRGEDLSTLGQLLLEMRKEHYEMRQEISELRGLVSGLMQTRVGGPFHEALGSEDALLQTRSGRLPSLVEHQAYKPAPHSLDVEEVEVHEEESRDDGEGCKLEEMERERIEQSLRRHRGRRKPVAEELGISERTLYRKIKEYDLQIK